LILKRRHDLRLPIGEDGRGLLRLMRRGHANRSQRGRNQNTQTDT
jgi:hypothetical protein